MLDSVIIEPKEKAQYALIWLHGLGADGYDFAPMGERLQIQTGLPLRVILPHARLRPVTLNSGYVMRAWYDIYGLDRQSREDSEGIDASCVLIQKLIQAEINKGILTEKLFLGGFSQGGAMALHTGLHYADSLAGIIAFSAYLPLRDRLVTAPPHHQTTPVFIAHGTDDTVVPFSFGKLSYELLQNKNYRVDWHSYPMAHQVCEAQLKDIEKWLVSQDRTNFNSKDVA